MKGLHQKLGRFFEALSAFSYDRPVLILSTFAMLLLALCTGFVSLKMDVSNEALLHKSDPIRQAFSEFRAEFSGDNVIILAIPINTKLNHKLLQQLHNIQTSIEADVPFVEKTSSIINARYTLSKEDELYVQDLMEGWPDHNWDLVELETYIKSQTNYVNRLISKDGKYLSILIELSAFSAQTATGSASEFLSQQDMNKSIRAIRKVLAEYPEQQYLLTGTSVLNEVLSRITIRDSSITSSIAILACIAFLSLFFRRVSGVVFPLLIVVLSVSCTIGLMGLAGAPYTLMTGTLVPLMIAVGIADSVHILTHFYQNYEKSGDKREAIIAAQGFSAPAVLLTSFTTAAGFLSFTIGDIASIADMGIHTSMAVAFALLFTILLLPALISISKIKQPANTSRLHTSLHNLLFGIANFTYRHHISICILSIVVLFASFYGATKLTFAHDNVAILSDDEPEKKDLYQMDAAYKGLTTIDIIIDSQKPRGLLEDEFISKLKQAEAALSNTNLAGMKLGESYSVLTIIRETNRALHNNQESHYKIPKQTDLIAQELLMFELSNAEDLRKVVDSNLQKIRLSLKTYYADSVDINRLNLAVESKLSDIFSPGQITVTGSSAIVASIIPRSLSTMIKSYAFALIIITLFMTIMVGNLKVGLISMIPNLLPILLIANLMLLNQWKIDLTTIMVGAIALGIVVDDTLHILFHYKSFYKKSGNALQAAQSTLSTTGKALLITSIIYSSAALCNTLGTMSNIVIFGITLGLITLLALIIDLFVLPAFLFLLYKNKKV